MRDKLLVKFKLNPATLKFREIEKILLFLDFGKRQGKGCHVIFWHKELIEPITFSLYNNYCKNYQKSALKKLIDFKLI